MWWVSSYRQNDGVVPRGKLSILPVRASAEGQVTSTTELHCLVSSWHKYELEPQGCGPPNACAGSDRPFRMSVASLVADPFRIRLLEGLSREERDSILGAASYRRLSRHTVVTNQADRANHLFLLLKGSARYFFIAPGGQKICFSSLPRERYSAARPLLPEPSLFLVGTEIVRDSCVLVWQRNTIRHPEQLLSS